MALATTRHLTGRWWRWLTHGFSLRGRADSGKLSQLGAFRLGQPLQHKGEHGSEDSGGVYLAHDTEAPRTVVLKVVDRRRATPEQLERLGGEIRVLSQLHNPHTVRLLGAGKQGKYHYLCLEAISGLRLDEFVKNCGGFVPDGRAMLLLQQLLLALAELHEQGMLHRDVTPANVMVSRRGGAADWLTLLDFGLAQSSASASISADVTPSAVSGTPAYLAPEVALLGPLDARADIYAVGCLAYFMLAGRPPFTATNPVELCWRQAHHSPPELAAVATQSLPPDLVKLVMGCLEKDPAARPQSARQLRHQLQQIQPLQAWSEGEAERWWNQLISGTT